MEQFQDILVALDTRFDQHPALDWASRLAIQNKAKLTIIDVVPELSWIARMVVSDDDQLQRALFDDKTRRIESLAVELRQKGVDVSTKVLAGKTSIEIIHEVLRSHHDLVVRVTKGAHSQGTGFFGTTSMRLLRQCPCAVWLVRPESPPSFGKVLVAVDPRPDDSERNKLNTVVMDTGTSISNYENGELHVVHTWELFAKSALKSHFKEGEFAQVERKAELKVAVALDEFLAPYGLNHHAAQVHLIRDEIGPGRAISTLVKEQQMDLVVMGTIARSGVAGLLLGNTAEHVLDQVECPILALKPDGFVSPISLPRG